MVVKTHSIGRRRLRVVLHTRPCFLDQVLSMAPSLAELCDLHIVLEVAPESRSDNLLVGARQLQKGERPNGRHYLLEQLGVSAMRPLDTVCGIHMTVSSSVHSTSPSSVQEGLRAGLVIRRLRPDVVHFNDLGLRTLPVLWSLSTLPIVLSVHDLEAHPGDDSWRTRVSRMSAIRIARQIVTHNGPQTPLFAKRNGIETARVTVVPLGAYDVFQALTPDVIPNPQLVAFVGRLDMYKGLDVLADAAPLVVRACPSVEFIVAGGPVRGYRPRVPELPGSATYRVVSRRLSNQELGQLVARARTIVLPYVQATQSGVLMVAAALGTPVVSTAVGGLKDYVANGQAGLVVSPGDAEGTAEAITRMISDNALHAKLSASMTQAARSSLSWQRPAELLIDVYQRAMQSASSLGR